MNDSTDIDFFKSLNRTSIKRKYTLTTIDVYKNKATVVVAPSGKKYWLKLFRSNATTIQREYDMMTEAAKLGVAPNTIMINSDHNFFVTEFVQNQLIEYLRGQKKVPFELQAQIYCLCARLDAAGVFHFYGDPTSIRISNSNRLYITAYEYSKPLEHADKNMKITLWKFTRQFRRHKLKCEGLYICLLYTSPSPRDRQKSRMPSSA